MPRLSSKTLFLVGSTLVMLLAAWLYWPTMRLPLIYDTLLHIRIAGGLNLGSVWLPTEAFGFYRPMTFLPLLLVQRVFGGYPAWLLHGNNVLQHAANAGLLVWLSWRLWADWRRAVAAGAIFAAFPFSYQAVAVYGHNVHPAMGGLVLLGLHSYLTAVSGRNTSRWWIVTWLLFLLMLLTHETAVLFGGFAVLVHLNQRPDLFRQGHGLRLPWRWFLLAGVAHLILYQFLPISRAPQVEVTGRSLWLNGLYVLQATVFPLAWFAPWLPQVSGAVVTLVSAGLVAAGSGWLAWRRAAWRAPLLLAWGWWAAAGALIGLALPTEYLLRGPRLLYLGGVGVALLWAQLLSGLWSRGEREKVGWRDVLGTAVLLFILGSSLQFVRTRLQEYAQLTEPVAVIKAEMGQTPAPASSEIVLVNMPQWLDKPPNRYAVGVEFVAMLGNYLFVEELVAVNVPGPPRAWAVSVPELQTNPAYAYGIHAQHDWPPLSAAQPRHFFITDYAPGGPQTRYTGYIRPPAAPSESAANFDFYQLASAVAAGCGGEIDITTHWLPMTGAIPDTISIFVQVVDEDGRLLGQADGPLLGIRPGLAAATPDWLVVDIRQIAVAPSETASAVLVGVYDFVSGRRSPAADHSGRPLQDNAWRIPTAACPETLR